MAKAFRTSRPGPAGGWPCGSVGWCSKSCTRTLTIYSDARGLVGGPVVRWVVFQKAAHELLPCILLEPLLCSGGLGGGETSPNMFCPRTPG